MVLVRDEIASLSERYLKDPDKKRLSVLKELILVSLDDERGFGLTFGMKFKLPLELDLASISQVLDDLEFPHNITMGSNAYEVVLK